MICKESLQEGYMLPLNLHKISLGCAIYVARARLISPERLMQPCQVAKLLGVKRQNIYEWVEDRTLVAEYPQGKMMFDCLHIEAFQQERQKRLQQRNARTAPSPATKKQPVSLDPPAETPAPAASSIDWDNVAE